MVNHSCLHRQIESIISEEIKSIIQTIYGGKKEDLKKDAEQIAISYLKYNKLADPITLARSSFYLAMKKGDPNPQSKIQEIKNNNGKTNKWWIYLVPIMEKQIDKK